MRVIRSELAEADITNLLTLRTAAVRHAIPPGVPMDSALRLGSHNYARSDRRGGIVITEAGMDFLEWRFLFCQAPGCDGVLRHWNRLSPLHAGSDARDPAYEPEHIEGRSRLTITCPKCAHRNVLSDGEAPTLQSHYVILEVLPPRPATAA